MRYSILFLLIIICNACLLAGEKSGEDYLFLKYKKDSKTYLETKIECTSTECNIVIVNAGVRKDLVEKQGIIIREMNEVERYRKIICNEKYLNIKKSKFNQDFERDGAVNLLSICCSGKMVDLAIPIEYQGYDFVRTEDELINQVAKIVDEKTEQKKD